MPSNYSIKEKGIYPKGQESVSCQDLGSDLLILL